MKNQRDFQLEQRIRQIATQEAQAAYKRLANEYGVSRVPLHYHNGVDAPEIVRRDVTYIGQIPYAISDGPYELGLTSSLTTGDTSATLDTAWTKSTQVLYVLFSNGDERDVSFTNGSNAISWTGGLSDNANDSIDVPENNGFQFILPGQWSVIKNSLGIYTITHNLGKESNTNFYSCICNPIQSTNNPCAPIVSMFENEVTINWFRTDTGTFARTDTSFTFQLATGNNVAPFRTQYVTRNVGIL